MSDSTFDMPPVSAGFDARGGWVLNRLMAEASLGLTNVIHAAAIVGNLGGESGLQAINERHPIVPGSRGGWSWAQWTGSRRDEFEAYTKARGLPLDSDQAAYEWLVKELTTTENRALVQLKKTAELEAAVYTFEVGFERPSDPMGGLPSRVAFAKKAIAAAGHLPTPPLPLPPPVPAGNPIADILAAARFQTGVQAFQRANGLVADGIIGPATLAKIGLLTPMPPGEVVEMTLADIIADFEDSVRALKEYEAMEKS
jgi:hypothetical protein